jgi:hypothetical protein
LNLLAAEALPEAEVVFSRVVRGLSIILVFRVLIPLDLRQAALGGLG